MNALTSIVKRRLQGLSSSGLALCRQMSGQGKLRGKVALVTASTEGIGFGIAESLASHGASVMICSRKESCKFCPCQAQVANVDAAVSKLLADGLNVSGVVCHVGKREDRDNLIQETVNKFGGLDILVSNAAVNPYFGTMLECPEDAWDKIFEINVKVSFLLFKDCVPHMKKRGGGSAIFISSIGGFQPISALGPYSVSKTALIGLTKALGAETASDNIRVNCVAPGVVRTKFAAALTENDDIAEKVLETVPLGRFGTPAEMGGAVSFLASDEASYITGETLVVAGGMHARLFLYRVMKAVVRSAGSMLFKDGVSQPSSCGSKEVLVDVKAAGINPVDYKLPGWPIGNTIVGFDFAGVIKQVGSKVSNVEEGDEVYGFAKGSLCQVLVANASEIAKKSTKLSFTEAAALPVAYITSLQSLRDYGKLKEGERLLVIGASGGCGLASLQIATAMKAGYIAGVCSAKNDPIVRQHGATEVVDYNKYDISTFFSGDSEGDSATERDKFDVVYDACTASGAGEDYKDKSIALLRTNGQYVAINGSPSMWLRTFTIGHKRNQHLMLMDKSSSDLDHISSLADDGKIKPILAKTLPFNQEAVTEGFELLRSRRAVGKIVFDITKI